jgi:hypothetical protein
VQNDEWIALEKDREKDYTVSARFDFDNIRKTTGERSIGLYKSPQLRIFMRIKILSVSD